MLLLLVVSKRMKTVIKQMDLQKFLCFSVTGLTLQFLVKKLRSWNSIVYFNFTVVFLVFLYSIFQPSLPRLFLATIRVLEYVLLMRFTFSYTYSKNYLFHTLSENFYYFSVHLIFYIFLSHFKCLYFFHFLFSNILCFTIAKYYVPDVRF